LLIPVYNILVFILCQDVLDCIAFKHILVSTLIDGVKEQDFMLIPFPIASPAVVLIYFLIVKQVKVNITK
jgi:hypothetical protein